MIDREFEALRQGLESLAAAEPAVEPCPTPDAVWAAVAGESDRESRVEILEHTVRCPACAEAWRIARGMVEARDTPAAVDSSEPETRESQTRDQGVELDACPEGMLSFPGDRRAALTASAPNRWGGLAVAASLAVAALGLTTVGWWWLGGGLSTDPGPEYRQGGGSPVEIATAEGAVVSRQGFSLRWRGPEGARYRVVVATETLEEVWRVGGVEGPETRVPAEALTGLPAGTLLLWTLEATTVEGGTLSLPTQTLILSDDPSSDIPAPGSGAEEPPDPPEDTEPENG